MASTHLLTAASMVIPLPEGPVELTSYLTLPPHTDADAGGLVFPEKFNTACLKRGDDAVKRLRRYPRHAHPAFGSGEGRAGHACPARQLAHFQAEKRAGSPKLSGGWHLASLSTQH
jgi:hypothetical protein